MQFFQQEAKRQFGHPQVPMQVSRCLHIPVMLISTINHHNIAAWSAPSYLIELPARQGPTQSFFGFFLEGGTPKGPRRRISISFITANAHSHQWGSKTSLSRLNSSKQSSHEAAARHLAARLLRDGGTISGGRSPRSRRNAGREDFRKPDGRQYRRTCNGHQGHHTVHALCRWHFPSVLPCAPVPVDALYRCECTVT